MGLGCDEQLEPPADKSPFKPLEPLTELPDPALHPNSPNLLHLSGQRRPRASAPDYPSAALAQHILGERSTAPPPAGLPAEVWTPAAHGVASVPVPYCMLHSEESGAMQTRYM